MTRNEEYALRVITARGGTVCVVDRRALCGLWECSFGSDVVRRLVAKGCLEEVGRDIYRLKPSPPEGGSAPAPGD